MPRNAFKPEFQNGKAKNPFRNHFAFSTLFCLALSSGCSSIGVKKLSSDKAYPTHRDVLGVIGSSYSNLSERTKQTLRESDLAKVYTKSPMEAARTLHEEVLLESTDNRLFALAEIHSRLALSMGKLRKPEAMGHHYLGAGYAFHFLMAHDDPVAGNGVWGPHQLVEKGSIPPQRKLQPQDIYDPRFIQACQLYNRNLSHLVREADPKTWTLKMRTEEGDITLSLNSRHPRVAISHLARLTPCDELKVEGIETHHRSYGLGVPVVLETSDKPDVPFSNLHLGQPLHAGTAFLRFPDRIADLRLGHPSPIELNDPVSEPKIKISGRTIPLETDTTTVLASTLARSGLEGLDYVGFLNASRIQDRYGLYLLEPYQKGKIPVILVHGLLSSPITWTTLVNDLMADPDFREKYQIWAYFYPTALPFLMPAADLRDKLLVTRHQLDPDMEDDALENMVLVGHSMGGLIGRMLTVDSGNAFWEALSSKPFAELNFQDEASRREVQRLFFFEKHPLVKRAIFCAAPFGGSTLSPSPLGRLAASVPMLPHQVRDLGAMIANLDPGLHKRMVNGHVPNSVELLNPKSPLLAALAQTKPIKVHWHAIAGKEPGQFGPIYRALLELNKKDTGDGVVSLESATLVDSESRVIVPVGHMGVHQHPLAVREIRRILKEHAIETVLTKGEAKDSRQSNSRKPLPTAERATGPTLAESAPTRIPR